MFYIDTKYIAIDLDTDYDLKSKALSSNLKVQIKTS